MKKIFSKLCEIWSCVFLQNLCVILCRIQQKTVFSRVMKKIRGV